MKTKPVVLLFIGFLAGAGVATPVVRYLDDGWRFIAASNSPDGRHRLEMYEPSRWQLLFEPGRDSPAIVRLTRLADGVNLGESAPFDIGGEGYIPIWFPGGVQQGSSARFIFKEGRWWTDPGH